MPTTVPDAMRSGLPSSGKNCEYDARRPARSSPPTARTKSYHAGYSGTLLFPAAATNSAPPRANSRSPQQLPGKCGDLLRHREQPDSEGPGGSVRGAPGPSEERGDLVHAEDEIAQLAAELRALVADDLAFADGRAEPLSVVEELLKLVQGRVPARDGVHRTQPKTKCRTSRPRRGR
jgi:hypothetical protein